MLALLGSTPLILKAQQKSKPIPGREIYMQRCMTCHQADGTGAPNMIPPLVKTSQVLGDKTQLIRIILNGLNGEIKVNGEIYAGEMPPHKNLNDEQIAAVLTYIRNNFGNKATPVTARDVKKVRAAK